MANISISTVASLVAEVSTLLSVIIAFIVWFRKIIEGIRCQLRSEMLHIYYRNREERHIRQYEIENFLLLYKAYKALKGNSFIDKIYKEVTSWEVIT